MRAVISSSTERETERERETRFHFLHKLCLSVCLSVYTNNGSVETAAREIPCQDLGYSNETRMLRFQETQLWSSQTASYMVEQSFSIETFFSTSTAKYFQSIACHDLRRIDWFSVYGISPSFSFLKFG